MGGGGKTPRMLVFLGEAVLTAAVAWLQLQKCLPVTTLTHQGLCWALQTWRAQAVLAVYCLCPALCLAGKETPPWDGLRAEPEWGGGSGDTFPV